MKKYIYSITGIYEVTNRPVIGTCVDSNIVDAARQFENIGVRVSSASQIQGTDDDQLIRIITFMPDADVGIDD